jgi:hypothetical protein
MPNFVFEKTGQKLQHTFFAFAFDEENYKYKIKYFSQNMLTFFGPNCKYKGFLTFD